MQLIKDFKQLTKKDANIAGGKGASLGEMTKAGIPIPSGFVILSAAFDRFIRETNLSTQISEILSSVNINKVSTVETASEKIKSIIISEQMPEIIKKEILKYFKNLDSKFVAVRSSATSEDSASAAWAGQLDSFLNTSEKTLLDNVKKCWASLFTPRAIFYRFENKLNKDDISVAVVVQKMVNSEKSGVAFSVHSVTADENQMIIEAGFGLGEAIVSGAITPDSYIIDKQDYDLLDITINDQARALYKKSGGGNEWKALKDKGAKQVLLKKDITELSKLIVKIENHYGFPCDIEWANEKGKFYITQSRPITTLGQRSNKKSEDDWFLLEEIPGSGPILLAGTFRRMTGWFREEFKIQIDMNLLYKSNTLYLYFKHEQLKYSSKKLLNKSLENINFLSDIDKRNKKVQKEMFAFSDALLKTNFSNLNDKRLFKTYKEYVFLWEKAIVAGWVDNVLEFENELFSDYLRNYLDKKVKEAKYKKSVAEVFSIFTTPNRITRGAVQEESLQKIAEEIRKDKNILSFFLNNKPTIIEEKITNFDKKINLKLNIHTQKYCWHFFMYEGPGWSKKDFITALQEILKHPIEKTLSEDVLKQKQILVKKLQIDNKHEKLLKQASEIVFNKDLRKHSAYYASYASFKLIEEVAKRIKVSLSEIRCVLPWELTGKNLESLTKLNLKDREKGLLIKLFNGKFDVSENKEADAFFNSIVAREELIESSDIIKGSSAYPGIVKGIIKIANNPEEMKKIKGGEILVAHQTDPDILPAMKLAIAFVTDLGGITCHAAIVSREMKKPCVVGTKIASKILKDGDLVEVDANNGIVRIIKKSN